jgi:hypothetical protein
MNTAATVDTKPQRQYMSDLSSKVVPSFGFVLGKRATKNMPTRAVSMDCEAQCLSGCKDSCITVSK